MNEPRGARGPSRPAKARRVLAAAEYPAGLSWHLFLRQASSASLCWAWIEISSLR